ncbi:hypothetical protein SAMN02745857_01826 [Andreprevotia lacus DSM 23236]|jgi:hypothetical protein|uniref:DUF2946 domain-containing protein n=1 Tax=Andreprevotia lacus DSM 23236 TaxID=1121001 RepID=A0A1W1XJY7_9NEIS|nr:hypothetical protein [Andreprevotia lacus]SMC24296.1 hypothetical protein SAMN02745857_01826 [Andreprevotia lacus DSM 23236]
MAQMRRLALLCLTLMLALTLQGSLRVWHELGMPGQSGLTQSLCSTQGMSNPRELPLPGHPQLSCPDCTAAIAGGTGVPLLPWVAPLPATRLTALTALPAAPDQPSTPLARLREARAPPGSA